MTVMLSFGTGCGASASLYKPIIMSSAADLEVRRRRVLWRSSHRGIREMDILMGGYAAREVPRMSERDLAILETLMDVPDQELLAYATGQTPIPANIDCPMLRDVLAFRPT